MEEEEGKMRKSKHFSLGWVFFYIKKSLNSHRKSADFRLSSKKRLIPIFFLVLPIENIP